MTRLQTRANLQKLREPIDRKSWSGLYPTIVNAFYDPSFNDICKKSCFFRIEYQITLLLYSVLPAAILQSPFFDKDAPK